MCQRTPVPGGNGRFCPWRDQGLLVSMVMTDNVSESVADPLAVRRKQVKFRAWHRGTRELDFLIGRFADHHVDAMTAEQMDRFQAVLDLPDVDVYNWIIGALPVPAEHDHDVMRLLMDFRADERSRG